MAFTSIPSADIATGKPLKQGLFQAIKDNDDYLYAQVQLLQGGGGIPNGSLETDSDADGVPDNWAWAAYNGGTKAADTTNFVLGTKSLKITRLSGATYGGGSITSDYVECSFLEMLSFGIAFKSTATSVVNAVYIKFYDASKVELATGYWYVNGTGRELWRKSGSMPLFWTWLRILNVGVPVSARYYKLVFAAGIVDATYYAAADINVDRVTINPNAVGMNLLTETIDQAEVQNSSFSWVDIGSTYSITVPSAAKYLRVQIENKMSIYQSDPQGVFSRAAIGTTYGTTVSTTLTTYVQGASVIDVSALSGARTLKFQQYQMGDGNASQMRSHAAGNLKYYMPLSITVDSSSRTVSETL
jgi:hypothetical protein